MSLVDLSDYTEAWLMQEYSGGPTAQAAGENGNNLSDFSGPSYTPVAGHIQEDNVGDGGPSGKRCRGWFQNITPVTDDAWFVTTPSTDDIYDIRGTTSWAFTGWCYLRSGDTGEPWFAGNIDALAATADKQAWRMLPLHSGFGDGVPAVFQHDGLTAWNSIIVNPTTAPGVSWTRGTWQFLAGGWNATTNRLWCYWGRDVGESYYNEVSGFSAGAGYDGTGEFWVGKYSNDGAGGNNCEFAAQQCLWWKGRTLSQTELDYLWNNHAGRPETDFGGGLVAPSRHLLRPEKKLVLPGGRLLRA